MDESEEYEWIHEKLKRFKLRRVKNIHDMVKVQYQSSLNKDTDTE